MKKSLLALAALTAFAGAASAQSSVTLFGIVDAGFAHLSAGGRSVNGMTNSGYNSSRLGFRGVEDLGGGLQAAFHIEGQLFNDTGDGRGTGLAYDFQRRSTVSLIGGFGEVRLGRDYSPTFLVPSAYDPFGTNSIATFHTSMLASVGNTVANSVNGTRTNNSVSYFAPSLGGLTLQVMKGFGEANTATATSKKDVNSYFGFRLGYAAGPLGVDVAYGKTEGATDVADLKYRSFGARYSFGAITPMVSWTQENGGAQKIDSKLIGALITVGQGIIRMSYADYDLKNSNNDFKKLGLGYIYNLSKRTAVYGTYARVDNDGAQVRPVTDNGLSAGNASPGGTASGFEFGIRHIF